MCADKGFDVCEGDGAWWMRIGFGKNVLNEGEVGRMLEKMAVAMDFVDDALDLADVGERIAREKGEDIILQGEGALGCFMMEECALCNRCGGIDVEDEAPL